MIKGHLKNQLTYFAIFLLTVCVVQAQDVQTSESTPIATEPSAIKTGDTIPLAKEPVFAVTDAPPMKQDSAPPAEEKPWFTGPLLTPSPWVVRYGYTNLEPYIFYTQTDGSYDDNWKAQSAAKSITLRSSLVAYVGISEKVAFKFSPAFGKKHRGDASSVRFEDLPVEFNFQLYRAPNSSAVKFIIGETFPTGEYQKLDSTKNRTDAGGSGSFQTLIGFIAGQVFPMKGMHTFRYRAYFSYIYSAPVHVRGFNAYGGAANTVGKIFPGNTFRFFLGLEYSLSQRWTLAMDFREVYQTKTRFSGTRGTTSTGATASIGSLPSHSFSLAPAIEYNFNKKMGLVAGPWFTFAGKNTSRFLSWAIAFNYYN